MFIKYIKQQLLYPDINGEPCAIFIHGMPVKYVYSHGNNNGNHGNKCKEARDTFLIDNTLQGRYNLLDE